MTFYNVTKDFFTQRFSGPKLTISELAYQTTMYLSSKLGGEAEKY